MKWLRRFVYNRGFRPKQGNPLFSPSMSYLAALSDEYFLPDSKVVFRKSGGRVKSTKKGSKNA